MPHSSIHKKVTVYTAECEFCKFNICMTMHHFIDGKEDSQLDVTLLVCC